MLLTTRIVPCDLSRTDADALNRSSGVIYTRVLVRHWRTYRHNRHWLSPYGEQRLDDKMPHDPSPLHSHSIDTAQYGFAQACKTTRALKKIGIDAHFPYHRKWYRTTIWKLAGIRVRKNIILLARKKGMLPIIVKRPDWLTDAFFVCEVRLVWDRYSNEHTWHIVADDGIIVAPATGPTTVAVDLGEIHPATITDGTTAEVVTCRALRSVHQFTAKRLAVIANKQSKLQKRSIRWKRIQAAKRRFRAKQQRRSRDLEHKLSRAVVSYAQGVSASTVVIGDVRDIADKVDIGHKNNQKISTWTHGRVRQYITYKAARAGIIVELVDEAYSSQTCPSCGNRYKPKGRTYCCPSCKLIAHRDVVGATNLLSRQLYGDVGYLPVAPVIKYRHPALWWGKRSRPDTGQHASAVAC